MATAIVLSPILTADPNCSNDKVDSLHSVLHDRANKPPTIDLDEKLVVSPYSEEPHLLDLRTLDAPNQLIAKALMSLKCLREDYATAPYIEIFNVSIARNGLTSFQAENTDKFSGQRSSQRFRNSL